MPRSASTFSLSDSAKSSAVVQRSNSLDHPPIRPRVPVCLRTPCKAVQNPALSPSPNPPHEVTQSLLPNYCLDNQESKSILHIQKAQPQLSLHTSQQTTTSVTSTDLQPTQNSKTCQPKSSQHLPIHQVYVGFQPKSLAPVEHRTFSESCQNPQVPSEPNKAVLTSSRRETLLWNQHQAESWSLMWANTNMLWFQLRVYKLV